ncbi:MAG: hypothetical protein NXI16_05070 [Alphaproteobacteria bacterium]|nr:hypothetical protein [Alphaproteobacteria bacterium]
MGAAAAYQAILKETPDQPDALHLLGVILKDSGQAETAVSLITRAVELGSRSFATLNNLALARLAAGDGTGAADLLRALAAEPGLQAGERLGAELNLALARIKSGDGLAAMAGLADFLTSTDQLGGDVLLAAANLCQQADLDGARPAVTRLACALSPGEPTALFEHANALLDLGDLVRAERGLARLTERFPGDHDQTQKAWANRLFLMNFLPETTDGGVYETARAWAATLPEQRPDGTRLAAPAPLSRRGLSKLRIGYLSTDFRTHHFLMEALPVFEAHNRTAVEVVALGDVARPDAGTARVEAAVDRYVPLAGLSHGEKIAVLRAESLDVLVGLTGYRADQRRLLAERTASYQVIAINNIATTGLDTVDGHLTDAWIDPPDADPPRPATETLHRMPTGYSCFAGIPDAPPVERRHAGPVTFGSFNNLTKLTDPTLRLWARLLDRVPDSRLLVKAMALSRPGIRRAYENRMAACGLPMDRVDFAGAETDSSAHLRAMARADIALDPIPFPGGGSSREVLWMGVPVVTLTGATWMSRVGASILGRVGLDDLVTTTEATYLDAAAGLAADSDRLADLRHGLRARMGSGPLMDCEGYTRDLETLLTGLS